jgi:hypothetical protein
MKTLWFLFFVCVVLAVAGTAVSFVHTGTAGWHSIKLWMTGVKWTLVPTLILCLPRFISFSIKRELTRDQRRLLMHSQVIMACLFVAIELSRGV